MADRLIVTLEGTEDLKRALLAMDAVSTDRVLRPIVAEGAETVRDLASRLAPVLKTPHRGVVAGALRKGIEALFLKGGVGYCHFTVGLHPDVYYGMFLEFGTGTGNPKGPSARVLRRRANYDVSVEIRRQLINEWERGSGAEFTLEQAMIGVGLSKREQRRQRILAKGGYLQGERRPNMPAQPFLRPAVRFSREYVIRTMLERLAAVILAQAQG